MKPWYLSKTLWINIFTVFLGLFTYVSGLSWVTENPGLSSLILSMVGGTNILLRFVTTSPIIASLMEPVKVEKPIVIELRIKQ